MYFTSVKPRIIAIVKPVKSNIATLQYTHTHKHTTILWLYGFCSGQPRWAGTRRKIHPLTIIVVINHPYLLPPSTTIRGILPIQSTCLTVFIHNLSPSFLWSTSWPGTLHFILHFLHPIIVFFSQHMPNYRNLFCCSTKIMTSNPSLSLNPLLGILSCSFKPHITVIQSKQQNIQKSHQKCEIMKTNRMQN